MSVLAKKLQSPSAAAPSNTDPNFNQVALLLHGDGTNGAQNNTFVDSSTNNFTITRNGNTTQGTFSPFSLADGQWSNYFDGSGDYLSFSGRTFNGNFCAECWFYKTANPTNYSVIFGGSSQTTVNNHQFLVTNTGGVSLVLSANVIINDVGTAVISNQWNHIAWVRSGSNCAIFVNGARQGTATSSINTSICSRIGDIAGSSGYLPIGYISNARIVIGSSVYDPTVSTLTVPTAPLTAITNTQLLTCQSNRFKDNSSNNFTITRNGDTKVTAFSPFAPSAAYSESTNGGSGYFDGTGDYLSRSFTSTTDGMYPQGTTYTLEAWIYMTSTSGVQIIYESSATNTGSFGEIGILVSSGSLVAGVRSTTGGAAVSISGGTIVANTWNHVAVSVNSGSARLFLNGTQVGSTTTFSAATFTPVGAAVGRYPNGYTTGITDFTGYISNLRIVQGSALYTSNFTPSTTPLTAITNTSLLLNFTNAGIIDNAGKNDIETVGNAQVSTSVKKYGTGSLAFDGTGDYLVIPSNQYLSFPSDDFTIECWAYLSALPTSGNAIILLAKGTTASSNLEYSLQIYDPSTGPIFRCVVTSNGTTETTVQSGTGYFSVNQWYHLAITRVGSTAKLWINGVNVATNTSFLSTIYSGTGSLGVGANYVGGGIITGYIDDLRITKGLARYTANFTPPTQAFPDQ